MISVFHKAYINSIRRGVNTAFCERQGAQKKEIKEKEKAAVYTYLTRRNKTYLVLFRGVYFPRVGTITPPIQGLLNEIRRIRLLSLLIAYQTDHCSSFHF